MKKRRAYSTVVFLTAFFALALSCSTGNAPEPGIDLPVKKSTQQEEHLTFYLTDTSVAEFPFVRLTLIDSNQNYFIEWGNGVKTWNGSLDKMTEDQGFRMPPSVLWHNDEFICLMTNWTGPYSQHLFLPLKEELRYRFFKEDIEYIDSVDNFVCYIAESTDAKEKFVVSGLVIDKKETVDLKICNSIGYPWYDTIIRENEALIITSSCDTQKINIAGYLRHAYK